MVQRSIHSCITILACVAALSVSAAVTPATAQFGLRGGANLSKFVGADAANSESARGLNLGASIALIHLGPLSIVPEVYYAEKGSKEFDPLTTTTFEFGLNYIEVPVLAKLSFPLVGRLRGYVAGGPAFAWNIDCSITATETGTTTNTSDCAENFRSFDTAMEKADRGVVFGAGFDFHVPGLGGLNLDGRLVRGLARLSSGTTGSDIKNQSVSLMLGWFLGR